MHKIQTCSFSRISFAQQSQISLEIRASPDMDLIWINLQVMVDDDTGCSAQETGQIVSSVRALRLVRRICHQWGLLAKKNKNKAPPCTLPSCDIFLPTSSIRLLCLIKTFSPFTRLMKLYCKTKKRVERKCGFKVLFYVSFTRLFGENGSFVLYATAVKCMMAQATSAKCQRLDRAWNKTVGCTIERRNMNHTPYTYRGSWEMRFNCVFRRCNSFKF